VSKEWSAGTGFSRGGGIFAPWLEAGADLSAADAQNQLVPQESEPVKERIQDFVCLIAVLIAVTSYLWWVTPTHALYVSDSIYYVGSAQSLAQSGGYHCPVIEGNPATGLYPPLQSIFLSVAWLINPHFPENQGVIKGLMLGIWAVALAGLFGVLRKGGLGKAIASLLTLSVGTSGVWAYFVIHCFSDILFAAAAFGAISLWLNPKSGRFEMRLAVSGLLLGLMYLTRIATFGFLPGVLAATVVASYRRRTVKPIFLVGAPVLATMLAWALAPKETSSYTKYFASEAAAYGGSWPWFRHVIAFCFRQSWDYANGNHLLQNLSADLPNMLIAIAPGNPTWRIAVESLLSILGISFSALCFFGAYHSVRHRAVQAAVATYVLQVLVWPFPLGFRGLLPLLPLFILWARQGSQAMGPFWSRLFALAGVSYAALSLVSNLAGAPETRRALDESQMFAEAEATGDWIRDSIPAEARIASHLGLPMLHIHQRSRHPIKIVLSIASALNETTDGFDYALTSAQYPVGRTIGRGKGPHLQLAWQSPNGTFQVLKVIPPDRVLP
jgi:hypothetical protein